jgi:hypothetical protein
MLYLKGELVDTSTHETYSNFKPADFAMLYIKMYGCIDGAHRKDWLIDQIARILLDATVEVRLAFWASEKTEYRFEVLDDSPEYTKFVQDTIDHGYEYKVGIPP